ncbi:hypothetical protein Rcae01_00519 [Novipirellula caenicola]|uniref:Uncharacterized protein n=1 Tax=Novipirellula caenicola TaxID=1536901 RepID=A0ABP9VIP6_9BACT
MLGKSSSTGFEDYRHDIDLLEFHDISLWLARELTISEHQKIYWGLYPFVTSNRPNALPY